jgi:plastocyanin
VNNSSPFTTRRGFIAAASFGVVSLYGLWAAFGAAPFSLLGATSNDPGHDGDTRPSTDPHGGHGGSTAEPAEQPAGHGERGATAGPTSEEFRSLTEDFVRQFGLPDGSVRPGRPQTPGSAGSHAGMNPAAHGADHSAMPMQSVPIAAAEGPIDVYLMAFQWGFEPSVLRLDAGTLYRFRMMAVDASHGASIQLGRASRIIRLRRGALVEQTMTFPRPGEFLVYCTVYCGAAHDRMTGRLIVA